jgi:hypothetical protein
MAGSCDTSRGGLHTGMTPASHVLEVDDIRKWEVNMEVSSDRWGPVTTPFLAGLGPKTHHLKAPLLLYHRLCGALGFEDESVFKGGVMLRLCMLRLLLC